MKIDKGALCDDENIKNRLILRFSCLEVDLVLMVEFRIRYSSYPSLSGLCKMCTV